MKHKRILLFICLAAILLYTGCKIRFTFTGTKVPDDIKTITIEQFQNVSTLISPSLAQDFSETLRDYFLRRTNFKVVGNNGDIVISGAINNYNVKQISLTGTSTASQNRLTITIKASMVSEKHPELNWEDSFTNFADFGGSEDLSSVEKTLQTQINEKIAQDIFNKSFGQW